MKITRLETPNKDDWEIPVEFLILHYTAVNLKDTLSIFMNPDNVVSAHIVIDIDGSIYELIDCLNGKTLRGRHAGPSFWKEGNKQWEKFNDFSIGIELINYNGNIFPYTPSQYKSLFFVVKQLQKNNPQLKQFRRVLGHEHIAWCRGKADPGIYFDWDKLFQNCFINAEYLPPLQAICPKNIHDLLKEFKHFEPNNLTDRSKYWQLVSSITELAIKVIITLKKSNLNA